MIYSKTEVLGLSPVDNIYDKFVIESLIFRAEDLFT